MKNENDVNALDELNKGACMGMDAIDFIKDKVNDKKFSEFLDNQYKEYQKISKRICNLYPKKSSKEPHKTSTINKVMTWYGIQIRTFADDSDSKIAELLLQGTNMGIIEGRRILNNKDMSKKVKDIAEDYVTLQEDAMESIKKYL